MLRIKYFTESFTTQLLANRSRFGKLASENQLTSAATTAPVLQSAMKPENNDWISEIYNIYCCCEYYFELFT